MYTLYIGHNINMINQITMNTIGINPLRCASSQERMINSEEEEGKGRSAKHPCERLKFKTLSTVVALLSLEQWHNAHGLR